MREQWRYRMRERAHTHLIDDSSEHDPQLHQHIVRARIKGRKVGIHKVVVGAIEKRRHRVLKEEQARAGDGAQLRGVWTMWIWTVRGSPGVCLAARAQREKGRRTRTRVERSPSNLR